MKPIRNQNGFNRQDAIGQPRGSQSRGRLTYASKTAAGLRSARLPFIVLCGFIGVVVGSAPVSRAAATGAAPLPLTVGYSQVLKVASPITRLSVTAPKIARVQLLNPHEVLVSGITAGSTDLYIWNAQGLLTHRRIEVVVDRAQLQADLRRLFPADQLAVSGTGLTVAITGRVHSAEDIASLHDYLDQLKIPYTDMTYLAGVQQVQLKVIVAEASRTAIRALGVNMYQTNTGFFGADQIGSSAGGPLDPVSIGTPAGASAIPPIPFNFLADAAPQASTTLLAGVPPADLELFIQALVENQYVRILAEPTLVAESGQEASFLAGGEFPIPVVQGGTGGTSNSISIEYKPFGVALHFRPVVLGDNRIRLHVAPEVSELSNGTGAVELNGFSIPAILTRQAETTLVLHSGQSFVMAGLISKETQARASAVPVLGQLPVLGPLFRSIRYQDDNTDLVVLVTANLVSPSSQAVRPELPGDLYRQPTDWQLFMEGRIAGQTPAHLAPPEVLMLKGEGFNKLRGPGMWATFDTPLEPTGAALLGTGEGAAAPHPLPAATAPPASAP